MSLQELQASPAAFRSTLRIDADGSPVPLDDVADDWQAADFAALDAGWQAVAGQPAEPQYRRAWLERPRGHAKTSDIAVQVTWAVFASRRKLTGIVAAADRDQAKLIRDAVETLVRLNVWLGRILDIQQWKIRNRHTGSELQIISSDVASSYGVLPDFIVCDELAHWQNADLWNSLFSSAAKRSSCLLIVITNAGFGESWQHEIREAVRQDSAWYFSRLAGPQASWITPDRLAEQRRLLPAIAYRRLWLNEWTTGSGDALSDDDIDAAIVQPGPLNEAEPGWQFFAGVDLGLSRDASAVAVVGRHVGHVRERKHKHRLTRTEAAMVDAGLRDPPADEWDETYVPGTGRLRLADVRLWKPQPGRRVSVEGVERALLRLHERFNLAVVGFDPWQAAMLKERIDKAGVPTEEVPFTGPNLKSMCSAVLEAFAESNLELYDHPQLLSDLRNLRVVEKSYGVRLDSPRGAGGHGDCATALSIALHLARQEIAIANSVLNRKLIAY